MKKINSPTTHEKSIAMITSVGEKLVTLSRKLDLNISLNVILFSSDWFVFNFDTGLKSSGPEDVFLSELPARSVF
ncbi:hypothetical protein SDC9_198405 [bioreactor metagenome]|uniref:Uncharacterized protein n=1 Tax=bioreactor metagenome TaxID=1076179 RepID=A0A645IIV6_9ZZZZ